MHCHIVNNSMFKPIRVKLADLMVQKILSCKSIFLMRIVISQSLIGCFILILNLFYNVLQFSSDVKWVGINFTTEAIILFRTNY